MGIVTNSDLARPLYELLLLASGGLITCCIRHKRRR